MKRPFSVNPKIISHLGEDLIKNESIALLELVKNSYDACASECKVHFHTDEDTGLLKSLTITDDGLGMNLKTINEVWLVIGTDFKRKRIEPNACGRLPLGEKGIGRLGVHKLGNKITLYSKTSDSPEVCVVIDWSYLNEAENIDDFVIEVRENDAPVFFKNGKTGTSIIIEELKTEWEKRRITDVYRNLLSLNSPFSGHNDTFKVLITSDADLFEGLPCFEDIKKYGLYFGRCLMEGTKIKEFRYDFEPRLPLKSIIDGRSRSIEDLCKQDLNIKGSKSEVLEEEKSNNSEYIVNLDKSEIGPVELDVIIYEMDAQILNYYANTEKKALRTYLKNNSGVRVYRDNVRVYDYGEIGNDWLGLDAGRIHRVGGTVSNHIILGSVRLRRSESSGLKEKTNREGFIENESYYAFVDAVNYALSLIVRERNVDKARLATLFKKNKTAEPVLSDLSTVIDIINDKVTDKATKKEILKYLYRIDKQYAEVKAVLLRSANAGLNLSVVIHELEKQVAALIGFAKRGDTEPIKQISANLEKIIRGYSALIKKSSIKETSLISIAKTALENYSFRFSDHKIEVLLNYDGDIKAYLSENEALSVLINLLDNSIFWLRYARERNRKISVYLTDQIEGYGSVIVSDNGPGFNIPVDIAIHPFVSGKPNNLGTGLGLHVASEIMRSIGGELLFPDKEDVDFPNEVVKNGVTKAIVALCFPEKKRG